MSTAALALLTGYVALHGFTEYTVVENGVRRPDEGTAAHLFQMLMAGQVPLIAWFVVRWLPSSPSQGAFVVALQLAAVIPPFALLYLFEH
jgi:hypothetical protein